MPKFKFKSNKKYKFNLMNDIGEVLNPDITNFVHTEIFSNKNAVIEGCKSIIDYQDNYIKLKLKRGFISFFGTDFLITVFENEKIIIKGNISSLDFCF